jgi:hypothetical protein
VRIHPCVICGDRQIHALGRCQTCYRYLHRNRADRPFELIYRLTERDLVKHLAM